MALFNTAAADAVDGTADESRLRSILRPTFAGKRVVQETAAATPFSVGAVIGGQVAAYVPPRSAHSQVTLDLSALADDIVRELKRQVSSGMSAWTEVRKRVPQPLHATLGRLIEVQLNWETKTAMRKMREAQMALERLEIEKTRGPLMPEAPFFTMRIEFDFYASLVWQYGSREARDVLKQRGMLLLGLRKQSSTLANRGLGSYDDNIVVLNGVGRLGTARVFKAATEPGAQYSQRAAPGNAGGRVDARYASVQFSKADGMDINKDGIKDAGRLLAGTYQYFEKTGGHVGARAFQVRQTQVVERDTDGDGRFTTDDPDRIDKKGAATTMYIHQGGADDDTGKGTWSAGCQTIPKTVYPKFLQTVGQPRKGFYYVLVNAAVGS
jgi:hypothetical protein